MSKSGAIVWQGTYEIRPGATLEELIMELCISQAELARRTGRPTKTINGIIKGSIAITPETALQFERVLGVSATFWNSLEKNYREAIARREERERLQQGIDWMKSFPVSTMIKYGWIEKKKDRVEQLQELLGFLGAADPASWGDHWDGCAVQFRGAQGTSTSQPAVAAWLRKGFLDARAIGCKPFSAEGFRNALKEIRTLTLVTTPDFVDRLQVICAENGVAVVLVRELPGCRVSGAARWMTPQKALIQLSLRYRSNDQLWFSFFHEAAHVLQDQKRSIFVDDSPDRKPVKVGDELEKQANSLAANLLIPRRELQQFMDSSDRTKVGVKAFATQIGIAPGIVVGRLQHEGYLPFDWLNDLKVRYTWTD